MILTEAEAAERWCPFMRKGGNWFPNGDPPGQEYPNCMGSGCMAWRWVPTSYTVVEDGDGPLRERVKWAPSTHGHCGLAGKV